MIITSKNRISFLWIVLATLPWVAVIFKDKVMGIAFTFSMRKFVENPAALTFLLTVPGYISWIVPPTVNYVADRIWTRWGRRKPFIITSWIGTITCISLMPLAPDFGWLMAAYMGFVIFNDLGGPVESLKMEIVPPAQRATSQAVLSWVAQVAVLVFWVVAIGRFHEMSTMFGVQVSGEQGLFWSVSIGMVVMLLFLMLGIKETNPHSKLVHTGFSPLGIVKGLFSRHLWPVYILVFSVSILGTGLGAFNLLLTTEQWGYTNQEMGTNIMVGGIINLCLIPLLGMLANKVGRGSVYVGLVIAGIVVNLCMFSYYTFVLYDGRPTLIEMVVFGEMLSVIGILTGMALTPFQYDFIPRNELGTFAAGSGLVNRVTGIVTTTLMGLFVLKYATMYLAPPGEMVRVALKDDTQVAEVERALAGAKWTNPADGVPMSGPQLYAHAWYATGAKLEHGRGFEIRMKDEGSDNIRTQRDWLEAERGKYRARRGYATNQYRAITGKELPGKVGATAPATGPATVSATAPEAGAATTRAAMVPPPPGADAIEPTVVGDPYVYAKGLVEKTYGEEKAARKAAGGVKDRAERYAAEAALERAAEDALAEGVQRFDGILAERANAFRAQVEGALVGKLLKDGEQVLAATTVPAMVVTFDLRERPDAGAIERTLDALHVADGDVIDLRVVPVGEKFELALSGCVGVDEAKGGERLRKDLAGAATEKLQAVMAWPPGAPKVTMAKATRLDLRIIEDPLDRHLSPITRGVNEVLSVVVTPATPEQRLNAMGRNLRKPGLIDHVGVTVVPGEANAIRVTGIVVSAGEGVGKGPSEAVMERMAALGDGEMVKAAGVLYGLAVPAAKEQRMTVATPVLTAGFAKQQYDYLAGYIGVFMLQLVGLGIVFFFLYLVRIGWVRRRGAEEAEAIR